MQHDQTRTSSQTAAPTTQAPAQAGPAAAPSNAARQENLGLGADLPECAGEGGLEATLRTMGEAGSVVLDALPAGTAVRIALSLGPIGWVGLWLAEQDWDVLQAAGALDELLAREWPPGFAMEGVFQGEVTWVGGIPAGATYRLNRTEKGFEFTVACQAGLEEELGGGADLKGAFGESILAANAKVGMGATASGQGVWIFPVADTCDRLTRSGSPASVLADVVTSVQDALVAAVGAVAPDSVRYGLQAQEGGSAAGGVTGRLGDVGGSLGVEAAVGWEGDRAFFELLVGLDGKLQIREELRELALECGLDALMSRSLGVGGGLRVELDKDSLDGGVVDPCRFELRCTTERDGRKEEDRIGAQSVQDLLEAIGVNGDQGEGFPQVDLRQSVVVELEDDALSAQVAPDLVAEAEARLPDHGVLAARTELTFATEVVVPAEAVVAAWGGAPPFTDAEDVLDAERVLAAPYLRRRVEGPEGPTPDDAIELIDLQRSEVQARVRFGAGVGGKLGAGVEVGLDAAAEFVVEVRKPADGFLDDGQMKALLAG